MSKFALFIEARPDSEGRPQYLIFPGDDVQVYARVTDGGKHGRNRWSRFVGTEAVIHSDLEPTVVLTSERDHRQQFATGIPSTLAVKAQKANEKSPSLSREYALSDLIRLVQTQDPSLAQYLRDARRTAPIATPQPVRVQPVQPVVDREPAYAMAVVPSSTVAAKYVHRKIGGVKDFDVFAHAQRNHLNVLLYGPTGPGKTTSAIAYAAANDLPVFMVSGTVALEPSQLFGRYIPDGAGGFVWQDGGVTELVRHGGVLILDEVNFIPSKIATVLFPLLAQTRHITLLDHRGETITAHPDLLIVGTMNPGYVGTQDLNAAFRNRFSIQVPWGYDPDVEKSLVPSKALRDLAGQLRAAETNEDLVTPTPTNALIEFIDLARGLSMDFAIDNFVARYDESEHAKVKLVIDTHRANIEADLGGRSPVIEEQPEPPLQEWEKELLNDGQDPMSILADLGVTDLKSLSIH